MLYRHAGRQAAGAAEQIRRSAGNGPTAAADTAWAAAATFEVTADVLHDPALRDAADAFDRAARPRFGRIPGRSVDGDRLRAVARLLALAGDASGEGTVLAGALIANLVALTVAVAELREAQVHAAQAAAARKAAEHMHAAMTRARASAPWLGQPVGQRHARSASQADAARHGFPMPLRLEKAMAAAAANPVQASRGCGYQPPKRAGPSR